MLDFLAGGVWRPLGHKTPLSADLIATRRGSPVRGDLLPRVSIDVVSMGTGPPAPVRGRERRFAGAQEFQRDADYTGKCEAAASSGAVAYFAGLADTPREHLEQFAYLAQ